MKFKINSKTLLKLTSMLMKAIPNKPVIPILSNFLFEQDENTLKITASDNETTLHVTTEIQGAKGKDRIAIPAKILMELLQNLPPDDILFETKNKGGEGLIDINWINGNSKIPVFNPEDFPEVLKMKGKTESLKLITDDLVTAISQTIFAVAQNDIRPILTGILFETKKDGLKIVASDSHKLVIKEIKAECPEENLKFVIPAKSAGILKAILEKETEMKITVSERNASFMTPQNILTTRLLEGNFPDYGKILPKDNTISAKVNRKELIAILKRMQIVSNKSTMLVKMNLSMGKINLESEDTGMNTKGKETLESEYAGEEMNIGLKIPTILEILEVIPEETVEMKFKEPNRPVLILPEGNNQENNPYTALLMPYKIS